MMNIAIVCGARPNFIKVAPLVRAINEYKKAQSSLSVDYQLVYTGPENDPTLEDTERED
jgi:UDP-N-acetylglucosamine 2-epimerase (non-hydrolysing)